MLTQGMLLGFLDQFVLFPVSDMFHLLMARLRFTRGPSLLE